MFIVYRGATGSGKTHQIYETYNVIKVDRENRSLSYLLLESIIDDDGKERCAWIDCSKMPPTKEEWNLWIYWGKRANMPIIVETRSARIPKVVDNIVSVVTVSNDILRYARLHNHNNPNFVISESNNNWWRVKSLVHGNMTQDDMIFRGFGEWNDPIQVFAQKPLDPSLVRIVLGAVRQFPRHYPILKALNETARQQGITNDMIKNLLCVLPRRKLVKKWAIPYTQQAGNGFMKWLRSVGLDRESYHASLNFDMEVQYQFARELQKSKVWKAGWKALKKKPQKSLTVEDIMNAVFQIPLDLLRDDLDIRVII